MARRLTSAEVEAHLVDLKASGLTPTEFGKIKGIRPKTIQGWIDRRKKKKSRIYQVKAVPSFKEENARESLIQVDFKGITIQIPTNLTSGQWSQFWEGITKNA